MKTRIGAMAVLFVGSLVAVGCGGGSKLYPTEGTVLLDGEPIEGAMVTFSSADGKTAAGLTSASGKFKLLTNGQEGVPGGTYKVTVTKLAQKLPDPPIGPGTDMTKAYQDYMKASGTKMGSKGTMEQPKVKSEIPERYKQTGNIPDQVVPASGPITIELKSK